MALDSSVAALVVSVNRLIQTVTFQKAVIDKLVTGLADVTPRQIDVGEDLVAGVPVVLTNGVMTVAGEADLHVIAGLAQNNAAFGETSGLVTDGILEIETWPVPGGLLSENVFYFATDAGLTYIPPMSGTLVCVGMAISQTTLLVDIQPAVLLA